MNVTAYQIIAPLASLLAIVYAWNLVLRQKKTVWEAILWTIFWGAITYIALEPGSISYLSKITGIQDRENAVLVTFLGVLLFIVFYLVIRLEELEQRQTRIIRKIGLRNADVLKDERGKKKKEK